MNRFFLPLLAVFVLSLSARSLHAQYSNYDEIFQVSGMSFGTAELNQSKLSIDQRQWGISGGYGWDLNDRSDRLTLAASYDYLSLEHGGPITQPLDIHQVFVGAEFLKTWKNPYWGSTISAYFGLSSDFDTLYNSSFQSAITGMVHYGKSNDLIWSAGIFYSDQPFGPWVFPILGVDWKFSKRGYLSFFPMYRIYLEYGLKLDHLYIGLESLAEGMSFNLSEFQGQTDSYLTTFSDQFPYYPYNNTLFIDWYIKKNYVLFLKGGWTLGREFRHYTSNHDELTTSVYNSSISNALILQAGFAIRFRKF
ncbi:hypothetical protein KFE98_17010 [bacterium SCSIO 12741]|nr:hypothetical protein KFE98_17010 [bacterium SCSIO 12741]